MSDEIATPPDDSNDEPLLEVAPEPEESNDSDVFNMTVLVDEPPEPVENWDTEGEPAVDPYIPPELDLSGSMGATELPTGAEPVEDEAPKKLIVPGLDDLHLIDQVQLTDEEFATAGATDEPEKELLLVETAFIVYRHPQNHRWMASADTEQNIRALRPADVGDFQEACGVIEHDIAVQQTAEMMMSIQMQKMEQMRQMAENSQVQSLIQSGRLPTPGDLRRR